MRRLRSILAIVISQQLFGVVVGVGAGLAVVEVGWWDPFGLAVVVFAGGPALVGHCVVGVAGQGEGVDVGDGVGGIRVAVVDLAEVAGHLAVGEGAPPILGVQDD